MKRIYIYLIAGLSILAVVFACNRNFLDKNPLGALPPNILANKEGVDGLLIGAYHMLSGMGGAAGNNWGNAPSNWVFGSVTSDEAYKGSTPTDQADIVPIEIWAYNANNPYFNQKWQAVYDGVQRCNDVLRILPLATDISADEQKRIKAEALFLRAFFHFEAKKMWKNVPYADENISLAKGVTHVPNVDDAGNYVEIWPKIEADLQFAADNLPETHEQSGRANKWAAKAFLAKAYLYQGKFTQAKPLFDEVIANGKTTNNKKYALVNFQDNFNPATDNSAESIFAYQAGVNDGSSTNGNYGDNLNYPNSGGPGGCCGFFNPSITMANAFKTDADGLPMFDTYNSGNAVGDPASPWTGSLDPRIDWTIGRQGIPYLDWGAHPGEAWIRDPASDGYFSPKKNVYAKSQENILSSTETAFWGPTQMDAGNVNLIRYADLLLMAAECEIEAGSAAKALDYVNLVRERAGRKTGWVYKNSVYNAANGMYDPQATPADNYKIGLYPAGTFANKDYALKAIRFERWLELALEGHRFFDLQRWNNKYPGIMAATLNAYAAAEKSRPTIFKLNTDASFTANKNEIYPIPLSQIDIENSTGKVFLKQNPQY